MRTLWILLAAGCGASLVTPIDPPAHQPQAAVPTNDTPERPEAPRAEPVEPAEGMQLAGGRLGSVLDGLEPGPWTALENVFGSTHEIGGPSDHVVTRTTEDGTYALHVVAWESFEPIPAGTSLADFALSRAGESAQILETPVTQLGIAARTVAFDPAEYEGGPINTLRNRGALFLGRLSVAALEGTLVDVVLACPPSAACRADNPLDVLQSVATSLRRGPPARSGHDWELTLPGGADLDRRLHVPLPDGVVGLAWAKRSDGAHVAHAVSLATARPALTITVRPPASHPPTTALEPGVAMMAETPSVASFACAPFRCVVEFGRDESARPALGRAWSQARVENVAAEEAPLAVASGRLSIQAAAPVLEVFNQRWDDTQSMMRNGDEVMYFHVRDTLRPADEALTHGFFAEQSLVMDDRSNVRVLRAGDPELTIRRVIPAEPRPRVAAYLLVSDPAGTGLIIEIDCPQGQTCDGDVLSAALALRLRGDQPPVTGEVLHLTLGGRRIELVLPDDYALTRWNEDNHGGFGIRGRHIAGSAATLEFENSGAAVGASLDNVGRATGRTRRARLGEQRLNLRELRRRDGQRIWGADLGCRDAACVVLIRGDDPDERVRLVSLLATAHVTTCPRAFIADEEEPLNLRQEPTTRGQVIRELSAGDELEVVEVRGSWARLAAPNEGWVWNADLERSCNAY